MRVSFYEGSAAERDSCGPWEVIKHMCLCWLEGVVVIGYPVIGIHSNPIPSTHMTFS